MELTALKRMCEHWGDRTPYLDLRTMIDAIDQFRERAELLELAVREGNEEESHTAGVTSDLVRDLASNLLSYGSISLQDAFIQEIIATCGEDRLKQALKLDTIPEDHLGNLDAHPF